MMMDEQSDVWDRGENDDRIGGESLYDAQRRNLVDADSSSEVDLKRQLEGLRQETTKVVSENELMFRTLQERLEDSQSADVDQMRRLLSEVGILNKQNEDLQSNLSTSKQESKSHLRETVILNAELAERTRQLHQLEQDLHEISQMTSQLESQKRQQPQHQQHQQQQQHHQTTSPPQQQQQEKTKTVSFKTPTENDNIRKSATENESPSSREEIEMDELLRMSAEEEMVRLRQLFEQASQRCALLEREIVQRDVALRDKVRTISQMQEEMAALSTRLSIQDKEFITMKQTHEEEKRAMAKEIRDEIMAVVAHKEAEVSEWEESLIIRENLNTGLTTKLEQLQNENRSLHMEIQVLQETPQEKLVEVTQTNARIMSALVAAQSARDEAILKAERADKKKESLQEELKQAKTMHFTQMEAMSEHVRRLENDNASLEEKTNELKVQFLTANSTSETTEMKTAQIQRKANARQSSLESYARKAEKQLNVQRDTITALKQSLKHANREIEVAQSVIDEDAGEMETLADTIEQLQVQNHDLFSKLRFYMQRESELACEMDDLRMQVQRGKFDNNTSLLQ
eukprot:m.8448 g.8448  ORF g.8448 m.8448 type:complete len:573 (-) comp3124_c0_seq1:203-1921(-)